MIFKKPSFLLSFGNYRSRCQDNGSESNQCTPEIHDFLLGTVRKIYQEEILPEIKRTTEEYVDEQNVKIVQQMRQEMNAKDEEWKSRFEAMENEMENQSQATNEIKSDMDQFESTCQCEETKERVESLESRVDLLQDVACEHCSSIGLRECDPNGRCICLEGYDGPRCEDCQSGFSKDASGSCTGTINIYKLYGELFWWRSREPCLHIIFFLIFDCLFSI